MPKFRPLPSQEELHRLFDYSVVTGKLYWKVKFTRRVKLNMPAGTPGVNGYTNVRINKIEYKAHRLIWMWVTGEDPGDYLVDHKNRQRDDNAWHNLRLATRGQNKINSCSKGTRLQPNGRWNARLKVDGKLYTFGSYATEAEARAAYEKASRDLHGEFSSIG